MGMRRWRVDCLVQDDLLRLQTANLWCLHLGSLEGVVFEKTFLDATVWELHPTRPILDSSDPLALVARAIFPVHFSVAVSLVILVAALVVIPALPREHSHAILLIILVCTFVHVAILVIESFLPLALAVLQAVLELSNVDASVFPLVLTLTFGLAKVVSSGEAVAIREDIRTLTVL